MRLILIIDLFKRAIEKIYRKKLFKAQTGCNHNNFNIVGKITLINKNIIIGKNVTLYPNVMFHGDGIIKIGDNVSIGNNTIIYSSRSGGVYIGDNSMIAANCYIIDTDHGTKKEELIRNQDDIHKKIEIGDDVWIGTHVSILKGSSIGDGAVIGANSLVKGEIECNSICAGSPAKIIKHRQ